MSIDFTKNIKIDYCDIHDTVYAEQCEQCELDYEYKMMLKEKYSDF